MRPVKIVKIVSWNVNGLRACQKNGFSRALEKMEADIVCLQETKGKFQLSIHDYLQYWYTAEKSNYSGTLVLAKRRPLHISYGMGIDAFDREGRLICLEYRDYFVINVYVPNSQRNLDRLNYRKEWDKALLSYLDQLEKPIILCGDFNVARDYIDIYPENLRNVENPPGFLSAERDGLNQLLASGLTDAFRYFFPKKENAYTWWSNRMHKRSTNQGWRLDYFLVSNQIIKNVQEVHHCTDILGSDHCPITLSIAQPMDEVELSEHELQVQWKSINWERAEKRLFERQQSLARSAYAGHISESIAFQNMLVESFSARVLAVRHVVETGSMAGVDGVKWTTDAERMKAVLSLKIQGYRAQPYRCFVLHEKGGKERRINVPTAYDKAMQTLFAFALDPIAESIADRKSFAFRKGRSIADVNAYILDALKGTKSIAAPISVLAEKDRPPEWVLHADVRACYDSINHSWLLHNIPMDYGMLREFLKAGTEISGELFPTEQGVSLGAALSPILGNLALDGLQKYIYQNLHPDVYPSPDMDYKQGNMIRFADDILITARSKEAAERIKQMLIYFLGERGLSLNENKTYIRNVYEGFEFLSTWYQRQPGNNWVDCRPSDAAVQRFEENLHTFIENFKGSQERLITQLNQKLNGWANYHRITNATEAFRHIDQVVWGLLVKKMRTLYPSRPWKQIQETYWYKCGGRLYFSLPDNRTVRVMHLAEVRLIGHLSVKTSFHAYLSVEYVEWLAYTRDLQRVSGEKYRAIWNRQGGRCYYCGKEMLQDQRLQLVEIQRGHGTERKNLAYIHQQCQYNEFQYVDSEDDLEEHEKLDLIQLLENVQQPLPEETPYWSLKEYFRMAKKQSITLTFQKIEKILEDKLPQAAYQEKSFWYDEMPEIAKAEMGNAAECYVISDSWLTQGYRIFRLRLDKRQVTLHREVEKQSGLKIPDVLLQRKLPDEAVHELNTHFRYIVKKYGL